MTKSPTYGGPATLLALLLCAVGTVHAGCGQLSPEGSSFGPFDYRDYNSRARFLNVVERVHFTPEIENLTAQATKYLAGDISYTLTKFPNHYRALDAISRLAVRENTEHPVGSYYSVDCWFQRAVVFRPRDGRVRMVYGVHLTRLGRMEEAIEHMLAGLRLQPEDARIRYTLGQTYLEIGDYENALRYAHETLAAGHPIDGLREGLERAGHWREPAPAPDEGAPAESIDP